MSINNVTMISCPSRCKLEKAGIIVYQTHSLLKIKTTYHHNHEAASVKGQIRHDLEVSLPHSAHLPLDICCNCLWYKYIIRVKSSLITFTDMLRWTIELFFYTGGYFWNREKLWKVNEANSNEFKKRIFLKFHCKILLKICDPMRVFFYGVILYFYKHNLKWIS